MNYPQIPETSVLTDSAAPPLVHDILLPTALTCPALPVTGSKSIFAFWHSGIGTLPPYLLRSVLAWYRRYSPLGWSVHIIDNVPGSPLNASHYIDTSSPDVVPAAFTTRSINGTYALQHTSDLIRYPLLLKYGGVYLDVGILQFGDLNWLWEEVISNPVSPYDYAGFTTMSASPDMSISNFSLMCGPANPLVLRAHKILLKLWEGKTNTVGMHSHPILEGVPLLRVPAETVVNDGDQAKIQAAASTRARPPTPARVLCACHGQISTSQRHDGH
uniref:Capsule polysaccharide biosynthesis protein n=1 Tax=Moniliophthora roreri TaxID=221103 RepID=A0A0W0G3Z8_MONRR